MVGALSKLQSAIRSTDFLPRRSGTPRRPKEVEMKYLPPVLFVLLFFSLACHPPEPIFRARADRDIPPDPSFTVIPRNDYSVETNFARDVEEYLMHIGVRLVRRPAFKSVETSKQLSQAELDSQKAGAASASTTERYYSLEETPADYIVETASEKQTIKIFRKSTREVLCVTKLEAQINDESPELQIFEILKANRCSSQSRLQAAKGVLGLVRHAFTAYLSQAPFLLHSNRANLLPEGVPTMIAVVFFLFFTLFSPFEFDQRYSFDSTFVLICALPSIANVTKCRASFHPHLSSRMTWNAR